MTALRWGDATDVGRRREKNQDMVLTAEPLFAVADGMGGHAGGEVAAMTAVEALKASFGDAPSTDALENAVIEANQAVWQRAQGQEDLRHMGTTLTAVALVSDGGDELFAVANVGDSRVYLLRDGQLTQLTDDHSVPQELFRAGQLSESEAAIDPRRNQLTRVLGMPEIVPDMQQIVPYTDDRLLLCSDGLYNEVADDEIAAVLRRTADPDEAARQLVEMANANGGNDNISVVVIDVVDDGDRAGAASAALAQDRAASAGGGAAGAGAGTGGLLMSADERNDQLRALAGEDAVVDSVHPAFKADSPPAEIEAPTRRFTLRVAAFLVVLALVLGGAGTAVGWYARSSYFVGLEEGRVVVFKGRPGGLLWFKPTVAERTELTDRKVLPARLDDLEAGKPEPTLDAARRYVANLTEEAASGVGGTISPPASTPPVGSTVPPAPATAPTSTEIRY